MYSKRIVNDSLERWTRGAKERNPKSYFEPTYHTRTQCEQYVEHFNRIVYRDKDTGFLMSTRLKGKLWDEALTPEEALLIRNERLLCKLDFWYWVNNYVWIKNEEDEQFRFIPWKSQEIFMDIVSEMQDWQIAIFLVILKARQLGISRIVSLILLHRVIFWSLTNSFMSSATEEKTNLLFDMADFTLGRMPYWLYHAENVVRGGNEKFRREGKLLELMNGSRITLSHGQQKIGIGRGTTITVAHISELAEYAEERVSDLIDSSLMRAMHSSLKSFLALEGNAKGINNWWHRTWQQAKSLWPIRKSRRRPMFLPWFVGGLYPKEVDLRARPIPPNYAEIMAPWARTHAEMAREYVLKTDYLVKRLGSNWHMPIEQIWYYECEREAAIRVKELNKFLQEMPANDDEAFQSTNISVFDTDTITYYRDNAHRQPLTGCYGLVGPVDYLNPRLQPDRTMYAQGDVIPVTCDPGGSMPAVTFELQPIRFDGWSLEDDTDLSIDKIYIWEHPMPGYEYGLGVDTGDGIEKDRTVIEVIRKASVWGPTKQVAEFASSKMNALDSTPFIWALGTYYTVPNLEGTRLHQPRLAIECLGKGDIPQNIIRMLGWRNFHPWNDKQVDNRKLELHKFNKLGVFTNSWWRTGMIDMLIKMLRDGEIEICSPAFVREMQSLEGDEIRQSFRACYGGHDDRIMALGFILVSIYKFDIDHYRSAKIMAYSGKGLGAPKAQPKQYAGWVEGAQTRTDIGMDGKPLARTAARRLR